MLGDGGAEGNQRDLREITSLACTGALVLPACPGAGGHCSEQRLCCSGGAERGTGVSLCSVGLAGDSAHPPAHTRARPAALVPPHQGCLGLAVTSHAVSNFPAGFAQ